MRAVGVPFTYRLLIPVLIDPSTGTVVLNGVSQNDLHGITLYDNIGADPVTVYVNGLDDNDPSTPPVQLPVVIPGTGVDLSLVGTPSVRWCVDLACQTLGAAVNPTIVANPNGLIEFDFAPGFIIPQGGRLAIDITVVLDDNSSANVLGKAFVNTAIWQFGRLIDGDVLQPAAGRERCFTADGDRGTEPGRQQDRHGGARWIDAESRRVGRVHGRRGEYGPVRRVERHAAGPFA